MGGYGTDWLRVYTVETFMEYEINHIPNILSIKNLASTLICGM